MDGLSLDAVPRCTAPNRSLSETSLNERLRDYEFSACWRTAAALADKIGRPKRFVRDPKHRLSLRSPGTQARAREREREREQARERVSRRSLSRSSRRCQHAARIRTADERHGPRAPRPLRQPPPPSPIWHPRVHNAVLKLHPTALPKLAGHTFPVRDLFARIAREKMKARRARAGRFRRDNKTKLTFRSALVKRRERLTRAGRTCVFSKYDSSPSTRGSCKSCNRSRLARF